MSGVMHHAAHALRLVAARHRVDAVPVEANDPAQRALAAIHSASRGSKASSKGTGDTGSPSISHAI